MCCESQQLIASLQKPPVASFQGWQGFIGLISVSGAAAEESTTADAVGGAPGKTVAIAAGASKSTDFPYGQIGTGRLSFRLRRLQRNAKPPDCLCSLRSVERQADCQPSEAARGVFSRLPGVHRTHQRRRSRHRRVHSCCRSWTNARKDSGHCRWRVNVHRLSQWAERNRKIVIPPPQAPAERQTSGHL